MQHGETRCVPPIVHVLDADRKRAYGAKPCVRLWGQLGGGLSLGPARSRPGQGCTHVRLHNVPMQSEASRNCFLPSLFWRPWVPRPRNHTGLRRDGERNHITRLLVQHLSSQSYLCNAVEYCMSVARALQKRSLWNKCSDKPCSSLVLVALAAPYGVFWDGCRRAPFRVV